MKWLEDELELNALHNPGSRRGSSNEKAALAQRTALSAALGGRVEVAAMSTISGMNGINDIVSDIAEVSGLIVLFANGVVLGSGLRSICIGMLFNRILSVVAF